jgi:hypothetical protein
LTWNAPGSRCCAIAADRGRIVREAIAVLLADLDAQGQDALLARRIASGNRDAGPEHGSGQDSPGQTGESVR